MEDLVKEADAIVSAEIEARQKQREKEDQLESVKEDDESPA